MLAAVALALRNLEAGEAPRLPTSNPYLIAYLRGGANEVLRLATVKLVDVGYLRNEDKFVGRKKGGPIEVFQPPVEAAVFDFFKESTAPAEVMSDTRAREAAECYQPRLEELGLLPDSEARKRRLMLFGAVAFLLLGTALLKILVAFSRGRHNILFLIFASIVATYFSYKLTNPRLTALGTKMLRHLQLLFSVQRAKASAAGFRLSSDESMLIAAIFGTANINSPSHVWVREAFKKSQRSSSGASSCGASCGSSCSSSSGGDSGGGSSCGSSCGGGGGCGGCGS